jgi:prepilin-type N-terminal cleavage/methylation domain-containing protein
MRGLSNRFPLGFASRGLRRSTSSHDRAFTLIELLVVVAILGILAVFLLMNLAHALRRAHEGHTYAGLTTMRTALETWKAAEMNSYTYAPGGNATNGYPWCIREGPSPAPTVPYPPVNNEDWAPGDVGSEAGSGYSVEKGSHSVYMSRYIDVMPRATVSDDQASLGKWDWPDNAGVEGLSGATNGVWQTNFLSTAAASNPGANVAGANYRGWHYRNTDGRLRINNTTTSTEGRRYDQY